MGLDLKSKNITTISGQKWNVADYSNSYKWGHAGAKLGIARPQVEQLFSYWEKHPYLQTVYDSQARKHGGLDNYANKNKSTSPYGGGSHGLTRYGASNFFNTKLRNAIDPFEHDRIANVKRRHANFKTSKDEATGLTLGTYDTYNLKKDLGPLTYKKRVSSHTQMTGPYGRQKKVINRYKDVKVNYGDKGYEDAWKAENERFKKALTHTYKKQVGTTPYNQKFESVAYNESQLKGRGLHAVNTAGLKKFKGKYDTVQNKGVVLNGAFADEELFNKMDDNQRRFFGKTFKQAQQADQALGVAGDVLEGSYQYRRGRARKKTGISAVAQQVAPLALGAVGALVAGPVGASIGSAFSTGMQGGSLADIIKAGATGYLGAKAPLNFGKAGSIWGQAGGGAAALNNAGPVQLISQQAGGNVGILDSLLKGGSSLLKSGGNFLKDFLGSGGSSGGVLSNILKTGTDLLFNQGKGSGTLGQLISAGGSAYLENRAANKQSDQIQDSTNQAIGLADPFAANRGAMGGQLLNLMQNPDAITNRPSYQFRFDQGMEALTRQLAASGMSKSGNAMTSAIEYGQGFASDEFAREVERLGIFSGASTGSLGGAASAAASGGGNLANIINNKYTGYGQVLGSQFPRVVN